VWEQVLVGQGIVKEGIKAREYGPWIINFKNDKKETCWYYIKWTRKESR
jgi:hypothetical protein